MILLLFFIFYFLFSFFYYSPVFTDDTSDTLDPRCYHLATRCDDYLQNHDQVSINYPITIYVSTNARAPTIFVEVH